MASRHPPPLLRALPEDLLWVDDPDTDERPRVDAGRAARPDVKVGRHVAVSPGAVPRFLTGSSRCTAASARPTPLAAAAAHHRLLWIHPFLDGNGRVARLMSHAMLLDALDTGGVWSVARGSRATSALTRAIWPPAIRRAGTISTAAARSARKRSRPSPASSSQRVLDQVRSWRACAARPPAGADRIWAEEEIRRRRCRPNAGMVLEAVLCRGELPRGEVGDLLGVTPRHARRIVAALLDRGVLAVQGAARPAVTPLFRRARRHAGCRDCFRNAPGSSDRGHDNARCQTLANAYRPAAGAAPHPGGVAGRQLSRRRLLAELARSGAGAVRGADAGTAS